MAVVQYVLGGSVACWIVYLIPDAHFVGAIFIGGCVAYAVTVWPLMLVDWLRRKKQVRGALRDDARGSLERYRAP
jgi:hypothetical protein